MNKAKKADPKKILVRNTERPVPKTRLIFDEKFEDRRKKDSEVKIAKTTKTKENKNLGAVEKSKQEKYRPKFQSPELNSTLHIAKKIDEVEKVKTQKTKIPEVAYCEKVTRKINFPSDQPVYKDLIPLEIPGRTPPVLSAREPLPQKDKEPTLAAFANQKPGKEFIYEPSLKLDKPQIVPQINNLRLYEILQMHQ